MLMGMMLDFLFWTYLADAGTMTNPSVPGRRSDLNRHTDGRDFTPECAQGNCPRAIQVLHPASCSLILWSNRLRLSFPVRESQLNANGFRSLLSPLPSRGWGRAADEDQSGASLAPGKRARTVLTVARASGAGRPRPDERAAIRAELGLSNESYVVGMCACVDPIQDHEDFVDVAAMLAETASKTRIVLIGAETDEPSVIEVSPIAARSACLSTSRTTGAASRH